MVGSGDATRRLPKALGFALLVLAVSGCRGASVSPSPLPSVASASPSPTPNVPSATASATTEPSPTPVIDESLTYRFLPGPPPQGEAPGITCDGSIGATDPVAIVRLKASTPFTGPVVLRDYADIANPRTVCTFAAPDSVPLATILDARHLLFFYVDGYAVVDVPEVRIHDWFKLPKTPGWAGTQFVALSPALDEVTWLSGDPPPGAAIDKIHVSRADGDHVVATLVDNNGGRCGQPDDSSLGAYTRSAEHVFVLDQPFEAESALVVLDGLSPVLSVLPPPGDWPAGGNPAMALWSPTSETLYYRQGTDVWQWSPGTDPVRLLANTVWYYPTISPDGTHLAYSLQRPGEFFHDSYLVDLVHGGAPKLIGRLRTSPIFLNNTQLWIRAEGPGEPCGPSGVGPQIYNIALGVESGSVIESVLGVWPATSSNS